jgi:hypothetical protein
MAGKVAGDDEAGFGEAEPPADCRVEVRGLLVVAAIGVVAIVGAVVVNSYRTAAMRARPAVTSTATH